MTEKDILRIVVRSLLLIVLIGAIAWFAWAVRGVLVLLIVSVIMATGLTPAVDLIAGRKPARRFLRLPRAFATLVLYLILILVIAGFFIGVIPALMHQANEFAREELALYVDQTREYFREMEQTYPPIEGIDARLLAEVEQSIGGIVGFTTQASQVFQFALGIVSSLFSFVLLLILTFYLIVDGENVRRAILTVFSAETRPLVELVANRASAKIGSWLIGQMLLSGIIGVCTFVALQILGLPYTLLLAVIAAIGEFIPMIGPFLSAVPAVIVATFMSPLLGLIVVGVYILIQQLESHVILPQVMRRAVDLPPSIVILALLMGFEMLGVVGAIVSLPIAAAVSVVIGELIALRDGKIELPVSPPSTDTDQEGQPESIPAGTAEDESVAEKATARKAVKQPG